MKKGKKFMNYDQIWDKIEELQGEILSECIFANAEDLGLDPRCGELLVCPKFIATNNRKALDYYGGFEYVKAQHIIQIGGLAIYSEEDSRVSEHLQVYAGSKI